MVRLTSLLIDIVAIEGARPDFLPTSSLRQLNERT